MVNAKGLEMEVIESVPVHEDIKLRQGNYQLYIDNYKENIRRLAKTGAKVALLDLNEEAAKSYAEKIVADGGIAKGYMCNVLEKDSIEKAHDEIVKDFGTCDILINGAGGNNPKATTDNEYFTPEAMGNVKTFFDLDKSGVEFVFNLNFLGTLLFLVQKDASSFVNGVVIPVDGGFSAYSGV